MQWQKCLEPEALCLLGYMLLTYFYMLTGHVEMALAYALIAIAYIEHLKRK
jgi:hypothetical protein